MRKPRKCVWTACIYDETSKHRNEIILCIQRGTRKIDRSVYGLLSDSNRQYWQMHMIHTQRRQRASNIRVSLICFLSGHTIERKQGGKWYEQTNKRTKKKKGKKIDHWLYLCIITYTHSGASHMRSMGIDVWRQVWAYWCSSIALATISRMELSHNWSACDWFRWPQNQVRMSILFSCLLNVLRSQSCAYFRLVQYVMYNTEIPVRTKPMMPEIYS